MEPDDLLCSRNARSKTPLVGRAQWKINQPSSLRDNKRAWKEHYRSVLVRCVHVGMDQKALKKVEWPSFTRHRILQRNHAHSFGDATMQSLTL